ncbi:hypothetical protein TNCV_377571 [Trichonephila clavipes]|nr:hypothetical protein TNCV_377571 [Trichonephila clavipes]
MSSTYTLERSTPHQEIRRLVNFSNFSVLMVWVDIDPPALGGKPATDITCSGERVLDSQVVNIPVCALRCALVRITSSSGCT